ncbi:VWA domain-containing protein [Lacinutrix iliipiscaria]|uniref:VWA domain-containing protein n=1 Tax=Lacinutrix iliipiscaria TaxID=1230532 RepID=A0ABW5WQN5_9FLAO
MKHFILILCLFSLLFKIHAQDEKSPSPILFIYDASGSMWGKIGDKTKKEIASEVLFSTVNELPNQQHVGLIAYGHRQKGDCKDVEFLVDINNQSKANINTAIKDINPLGKTPLAYSAAQAIAKLKQSKTKATIILITDGIESCDGNICDVVANAKSEGIDFKLHIVGFGLKEGETEQLKCAAQAGEGNYYDASDASGLAEGLSEATSQTIDTNQGNVSIYTTKNGEPVDAWIKAKKAGTNDVIDGSRTYRDSAWIYLPPGKYDIDIVPLENSKIKGTSITLDIKKDEIKHETISFDGGKINIITLNNNEGWDCTSTVKSQDGKAVGHSRTYGRPQVVEVNPGTYDIEIVALRMNGLETKYTIEDVLVESGKTIDATHNFKTGIAKLGVQENGKLVDVVVNIYSLDKTIFIAGGRSYTTSSSNPREFILNPGKYAVKLRGRKQGTDTIKWFEITVVEKEAFTKMFEW